MKKLLILAAFVFATSLPTVFTSTTADAEPWYAVINGSGPHADGKVNITSHAGSGKVKCVIKAGQYLHRNHEQNWSRFIHVQWKIKWFPGEWHYKDANGKWCPVWDRKGWVDKQDPDLVNARAAFQR